MVVAFVVEEFDAKKFVVVAFPATRLFELSELKFPVSPAIVWPVRLATVVDASVDEPETVRLVKAPSAAVIRFVNIELRVA